MALGMVGLVDQLVGVSQVLEMGEVHVPVVPKAGNVAASKAAT